MPAPARPMPAGLKLLTGLAATYLIATAGYRWQRQAALAMLGGEVAAVMLANGIDDGAARWNDANDHTSRTARLSGTADAATRARITAALADKPGIHAVVWQDR